MITIKCTVYCCGIRQTRQTNYLLARKRRWRYPMDSAFNCGIWRERRHETVTTRHYGGFFFIVIVNADVTVNANANAIVNGNRGTVCAPSHRRSTLLSRQIVVVSLSRAWPCLWDALHIVWFWECALFSFSFSYSFYMTSYSSLVVYLVNHLIFLCFIFFNVSSLPPKDENENEKRAKKHPRPKSCTRLD